MARPESDIPPLRKRAAHKPAARPPARASAEERPLKTLERVVSKTGLGSRTEARRWIHAGRVRVNGRVVQDPDRWVDLERDRVLFDGAPLSMRDRVYILLYKPTGYLTTHRDPQGRPTVFDLLTDVGAFVSPVGRLDLDTSGLLLLTNDTALKEHVTNPESHVPKTYLVKASLVLSDAQLQQLADGIELNDGPTRPARVVRVRDSAKYTHFEITLTEGRNRQVRRMVEALGATVLKLVRVKIGSIAIGPLRIGTWRHLSASEVETLKPGGRSSAVQLAVGGNAQEPGAPQPKGPRRNLEAGGIRDAREG